MALALTAADAADANRFRVNANSDHKPARCTRSDCTLREAVIRANERDGPDVVLVPGGETYPLTRAGAGEDAASKGDLDLGADFLDMRGTGSGRAVIDQTAPDRALHVADGADVGIEGLTIQGGRTDQRGGGIYTQGDLGLSEAVVRGNRASQGGGVAAFGSAARISITNSTVSGNRAELAGGGAYVVLTDGATNGALQSTISGNRAPQGGGVYFLPGDAGLNVVTSTIAGNVSPASNSTSDGGGLFVETLFAGPGTTKLAQSTIAANEAPAGSGANIHAEEPTQLESTLIGPPLGGGASCDIAIDSVGHNLDTGTSCGLDQATDVESAEPGLKSLADNGGLTRTMALKAGSDAIEEGTCPGTLVQRGVDQRGAGRPSSSLGLSCDIGAFEREPTSGPD